MITMKRMTKKGLTIQEPSIVKLTRPLEKFIKIEGFSSIILILCIVGALFWANTTWKNSYSDLWNTQIVINIGSFELVKPLLLWINDGLMAIFFCLIGLEIKREVLVGELSDLKNVTLPIIAALGGLIIPAFFYIILNINTPFIKGFGIPMATDIAIALGILILLGNRIPTYLKIFFTTLAITDDIGAIIILSIFYTETISWVSLLLGAGFLALLIIANKLHINSPIIYTILGIGLWLCILKSGIHATIGGLLFAFTIPVRIRINSISFLETSRKALDEFEMDCKNKKSQFTTINQRGAIHQIEEVSHQVQPLLQRMEHGLYYWVALLVVPIFVLANAGVTLGVDLSAELTHSITLGVLLGLVIGKPLGISLFVRLAIWGGLAAIPSDVNWRQIYGVSCLGGIGFTMSLFIANVAFGGTPQMTMAKIGILLGSVIAGFTGWLILRGSPPITREGTNNVA
jgi:NhaA family Na+:H+ antiporter